MAAHTPTMQQQALIERLHRLLESEPRVGAAFLSGSLGKGQGDAYSDVDILAIVPDGSAAAISADLARRLPEIAAPVLVNSLFGGRVLNVVTDDWQRFDLSFAEAKEVAYHDAEALKPLFHRDGPVPSPHPKRDYRIAPEALLKMVEEFLRVSGLAVVGAGRREYLLMMWGVELLARMTMDLMLEENGIAPAARGGALHRNPFLTDEQRAELEGLPPLAATRESVLAANRYLAGIFLPRARRLAADVGMTWPAALEEATRRSLRTHLDLAI